jgi:3-oxoacyl-[acyl-carrier-protein] synthase II
MPWQIPAMKAIPGSSLSPLTDQIVITGLGGVCSLGNSIMEIGRGLTSGKSGIEEITDFDIGGSGFLAAQVKDLPAIKTDIHPQLARSMGKHLSLLLASTEEALGAAGIGSGMFDPQDIGFFAGMGMVDYHVEDLLPAVLKSLNQSGGLDYDRFFSTGCREIYPLWPLGMLNNVVFSQAAIHFGLRGENCVFSPHGDAGIQAVAEAVKVLREGKAKVALAGGVSEEISPLSLARAKLKGLIRPHAHKPGAGNAKGAAAGLVLGEGGAMLVLEPQSGAIDRGANILARVLGFGFSCEKDRGGYFASEQAIFSAIKGALSQAELGSGQIDLIMFASLSQNELEAVRKIFDMDLKAPVTVATAGTVGETLAAGPILNTAIGLSIPNLALLRQDIRPYLPSGGGPPGGPSNTGRVLINGISYEGRCASMIVEKTFGENI